MIEGQSFPLLSATLLTPLAGSVLLWTMRDAGKARWVALSTAVVDLVLALIALARFHPADPGFQLVERVPWVSTLNVHYHVGVDGISVLLLPLTALLFAGAIGASWSSVRTLSRLYYSLLLLLQTSTLGVFLALDTILFFLFWEITLIPIYFLVSLWGVGPNRRYAAANYALVMLAGGVPLLFGFIVLAFQHPSAASVGLPFGLVFDYPELLKAPPAPAWQGLVFLLLTLGFAVKVPLFPLHTWLPVLAKEGPAPLLALITGLKLGVYGLIRFVVPLTPVAAQTYHWVLSAFAVVGILYGALAALGQTNLRRMLAYASVSHAGFAVLGISALNIQGIQGAVFQLLNFPLVAGGLFLLAGFLHHRIGSTDSVHLGGAARTMPLLAASFFLFGLAGMGVPGTSGFPAENLILIGALRSHAGSGMAALFGVVLTAAYFLGAYRKSFFGPLRNAVLADAADLRPRELAISLLLAAVVFIAGVWPQAVLDLIGSATEAWVAQLSAGPPG